MTLKLIRDYSRVNEIVENPDKTSMFPRLRQGCLKCLFREHPECADLVKQVELISPFDFSGACEDAEVFQYFGVEVEV